MTTTRSLEEDIDRAAKLLSPDELVELARRLTRDMYELPDVEGKYSVAQTVIFLLFTAWNKQRRERAGAPGPSPPERRAPGGVFRRSPDVPKSRRSSLTHKPFKKLAELKRGR